MPLVSYAQNFEDVILWRALHHIDRGFYIDVGAYDPVVDSVSLAFYEKGWRGVHVEPMAECAEKLRQARPDEEVIQAAVATRTKDLVFYEIPGSGLSTGSRAVAERHRKRGYEVRESSVSCVRLSDVLDRHRDGDIHWLKIDVEGMELQAIRSWTPSRVRPWIVVVESTEPNSAKPNFAAWEPLLTKLGYEFVYFDGLNRFYVSRKHRELKESFGAGPNVFDDYILNPNHPFFARLNAETATLRQQLAGREKESAVLAQTAETLRAEAAAQAGSFAKAVAGFENATAGLKAEIAAKIEAIAASESARAALKAEVDGKDRDMAARDERIAELDTEISRLAQDEAHLREQLTKRTVENGKLSPAAEELRAEAAALAARFAEATAVWEGTGAALNEELSARNEALATRDQRIAALESEIARVGGEESQLRQQLAERAEETVRLSKTIEELRTEAAAQAARLAEATAVWESTKQALNGELSARIEALNKRDEQLAALQSEMARIGIEVPELRRQLAERSEETVRLSKTIEKLRAEAAAESENFAKGAAIWGAEISRLNEESSELSRQLAKGSEANAELVETAKALRAEAALQMKAFAQATAAWESNSQTLSGELSARIVALSRQDEQIAMLQSETGRLSKEASELRRQLAGSAEEFSTLSQTTEDLRAKAAEQTDMFAQAAADWASQSADLNAKLETRTEALRARDQQVAALDVELLQLGIEAFNLLQQLANRTEEIERASRTAEALREEAALQAAAHAEAAADWASQSADLNGKLTTTTEALATRDQQVAALNAELLELGIEAFNLRQQLAERMDDIEQASRAGEALREGAALQAGAHAEAAAGWAHEIASLQSDLSARDQSLAAQSERIATLDAEIGQLRAELTDAKGRESNLGRQLATYHGELHRLHQAIGVQKARSESAAAIEVVLGQEVATLRERLAGVYHSTSWRVTAPFRFLSQAARNLARGSLPTAGDRPRTSDADEPSSAVLTSQEGGSSAPLAPEGAPVAEAHINLAPEPQSVRVAYQRLLNARQSLNRQRPMDWKYHSGRPRLAYISPLPPERSGISDYSAELLPELARHYAVDVVIDQAEVSDPWIRENCPIRDTAWFGQHAHFYDRILYHFGNSPFHQHMFDLVNRYPGVVVLHDFYLSGAIEQMDFHGGRPGLLARWLYLSHGYRAMQEGYRDKDSAVWKYPVNLPLLQSATGIIVHTSYSQHLAKAFYADSLSSSWAVIPPLRRLPEKESREAARQILGLGNEDFVACCFGMMGESKLNHRLLQAWLDSEFANDPQCYLIFVGQDSPGAYGAELRRCIERSPAGNQIRITGFASPEHYHRWLCAADVAVQLRGLSRGEASAAALDCMAYALPTIVNAHASMAELPRDSVIMLPDDFSDAELTAAVEALRADPIRSLAVGENARAFIKKHLSPSLVADRYYDAIEKFAEATPPLLNPQALITRAAHIVATAVDDSAWLQDARKLAEQAPRELGMRQLLVDVSAITRVDLKTGIQRVVKAQLLALMNNPPPGFRVEPVCLRDSYNQWSYYYAREYMAKLLSLPDIPPDDPVEIAKGDIFFAADFFSAVTEAAAAGLYADWSARGVKINFLVYDLLPLLLPQCFPVYAEEAHAKWLSAVASNADRLICISRAVAEEARRWLETHKPEVLPRVEITFSHLGADIDAFDSSKGTPSDATSVLEQLSARPSFLMVGTIEPRKGHLQALSAFEQLWGAGMNANLVIVGAEGWGPVPPELRRNIPQIVEKLRAHPEMSKRLFWLEGISDEYLDKVYAASTCLIAASENEGFGLPLIEAARHKLPILARDIAVFREVAGTHACYFSGKDPEDLAHAIKEWLKLFAENRHSRSDDLPWLTWAQSTERLKEILLGDVPASEPSQDMAAGAEGHGPDGSAEEEGAEARNGQCQTWPSSPRPSPSFA